MPDISRRLFPTLRSRLVLLNLAVVAAIQIAFSAATLIVARHRLLLDFDNRLKDAARGTADILEITQTSAPRDVAATAERLVKEWLHDSWFQITMAESGAIEARSAKLGDLDLPLDRRAPLASRDKLSIDTLHEPELEKRLGDGHAVRQVTFFSEETNKQNFFIQVGASTAQVDNTLGTLQRVVLVLLPIGLAISAAASWWLVRRTLAPIRRVVREAAGLTAAQLDRRLPTPGGRDEVAELVDTLNAMLDRLEAAFRAQERFVANAAHELKTPITHLLGRAQVLARQSRRPEEYDRFVAGVEEEMRQLSLVVESLLLLARADAGFSIEAGQPVSLNDVLVDVVQRLGPVAAQREVRIEPRLASAEEDADEPVVTGDPELLHVMLSNLLRNAIRFSPPRETVAAEVRPDGGQLLLRVVDAGPGIPTEQLTRIFERFQQVTASGETATGTGLGLAIAQSVARLHRGTITARNLERGCAFEVALPRADAPPAHAPG